MPLPLTPPNGVHGWQPKELIAMVPVWILAEIATARLMSCVHLSTVEERVQGQSGNSGLHVGAFEDNGRGLSAQFECDRTQELAAHGADTPARRTGTGERDFVDAGMSHQIFTVGPVAGNDV
jgi:hypothetical protein